MCSTLWAKSCNNGSAHHTSFVYYDGLNLQTRREIFLDQPVSQAQLDQYQAYLQADGAAHSLLDAELVKFFRSYQGDHLGNGGRTYEKRKNGLNYYSLDATSSDQSLNRTELQGSHVQIKSGAIPGWRAPPNNLPAGIPIPIWNLARFSQ